MNGQYQNLELLLLTEKKKKRLATSYSIITEYFYFAREFVPRFVTQMVSPEIRYVDKQHSEGASQRSCTNNIF